MRWGQTEDMALIFAQHFYSLFLATAATYFRLTA